MNGPWPESVAVVEPAPTPVSLPMLKAEPESKSKTVSWSGSETALVAKPGLKVVAVTEPSLEAVAVGKPELGTVSGSKMMSVTKPEIAAGTSLVAQWLRICLPMQGTRVQALVREDPTCRGAAKPVHRNY